MRDHPTRLVYAWSGDWETTGIWLFSFVAVTLGICTLPKDLKWSNILGANAGRYRVYHVYFHNVTSV
jgi:hypothetical protein